jgi:UDP-arabinose 4-epimerase
MSRPLLYYRVNVAGLVNVLEAMLRYRTRTIVLSSSCATYGIPDRLPIAEEAPQRPIYGRSKLAGEQILTDARSAEKLRVAQFSDFDWRMFGGKATGFGKRTTWLPLVVNTVERVT